MTYLIPLILNIFFSNLIEVLDPLLALSPV